ncbi:hypothetical protein D3C75_1128950 [compost metagenome]
MAISIAVGRAKPSPTPAISVQRAIKPRPESNPVPVPRASPVPRNTNPAEITALPPNRGMHSSEILAPARVPPIKGRRRSPVPKASVPFTA